MKKRILCVDDEEKITKVLCKLLEHRGFEVEAASSAQEAISIYTRKDFDLVITDLKMPIIDGIELIQHLRSINPDQPVIIATGFPARLIPWNKKFAEPRDETFTVGSIGYLVKPFSGKTLFEAIDIALDSNNNGNHRQNGNPINELDNLDKSVTYTCDNGSISCKDLILMYALQGRSVVLEATNTNQTGYIYIKQGRVVHARTAENEGESAFFKILSWHTRKITTRPYKQEISRTIKRGLVSLLLPQGSV